MRANLYRIDDLLLRSAGVTFGLVLIVAGVVVLVGLAEGATGDGDPGLAALARHGAPLALALLCPAALLTAGLAVRRRERRIFAIWTLLRRNAVLSARELLANSDFERGELEQAVRFLNNHGFAHYVWDRAQDTIRDGRLRASRALVEKCGGCGAALMLEIPLGSREIARCPYCDDPVSCDEPDESEREQIEALRAEFRGRANASGPTPLSLALFFVLLFVFWPAALGYAWLTWRSGLEKAPA